MKFYNTLVTLYKSWSRDSTSDNETMGKENINFAIKDFMGSFNYPKNETDATDLTEASVQYYPLPYNCEKVSSIKVNFGDIDYVPEEIKDRETWDIMNIEPQVTSDSPQYYFVDEESGQYGFYPKPSSASGTITIRYQRSNADMGVANYTTGTVSASINTKAVTGSGTSFTAAMVGRYIEFTNFPNYFFKITAVTDGTHLTLEREVPVAISGSAITIGELVPLPDGFENLPLYYALDIYFSTKEKAGQSTQWGAKYKELERKLRRRFKKSTRMIITKGRPQAVNPNKYPRNLT